MQTVVPKLELWSDSHSSAFEPTKTKATIFLPLSCKLHDNILPITHLGHCIEYTNTLTMLVTKQMRDPPSVPCLSLRSQGHRLHNSHIALGAV